MTLSIPFSIMTKRNIIQNSDTQPNSNQYNDTHYKDI